LSQPHPKAPPCGSAPAEATEADRLTAASENPWRLHIDWLRAALRRRFGPDLADDLAQDAYVRLADREGDEEIRNPRGLLWTVAANLARDRFRHDRVRAGHAAEAPEALDVHAHWARTAEDDLQVRQAILSLPPDLRDTLLLQKIGGLTNREIAQRYGLSVRAVDKRLQKAITLFVARLRD
jgi:RNA polymerase sigma-70 factor (ECF subfamily)